MTKSGYKGNVQDILIFGSTSAFWSQAIISYFSCKKSQTHIIRATQIYSYFDLMFFWPCIMNWLYINYQLDALIIIYS